MNRQKRRRIVVITSILSLFICLGLIGAAILINMQIRHQQLAPIYSPNHQNMVVPSINTDKTDMRQYLCIKISIVDTISKKVIFEEQTFASSRMNWSIRWLGNQSFILDSSDIGPSCWQEVNGTWKLSDCPK